MHLETEKQTVKTVLKNMEKVANSNGHLVLTGVCGCGAVSCLFFAQHDWLIIYSNWSPSSQVSSQESVNGHLTASWLSLFSSQLICPLLLHRLNFSSEMLKLEVFLASAFTGMGLGSACDCHNNSLQAGHATETVI